MARGADMRRIVRLAGRVIGWTLAYSYGAFVIVASLVAALSGIAVVAFILLEAWAIITGQG